VVILRQAVRRRVLAGAAAAAMSVPGPSLASPGQEDVPEDEALSTEHALVDIDIDVAEATAGAITGTMEELQTNVSNQLTALQSAETALDSSIVALADADNAVANTELLIEEKTAESDAVVVESFINPPHSDAIDVLAADSALDATLKQSVLDMQADQDADVLADLQDATDALEEQRATQEEARATAEAARADAESALANLQAAVSQQTQFVQLVQQRVNSDSSEAAALAGSDPAQAEAINARIQEIAGSLGAIQEEQQRLAALWALQEADRQRAAAGLLVCPVQGSVNFTDTWGAARSGGRTHKGTDMMASTGTPTVAPVAGRVVHRSSSLGGMSWYIYGDNGHTYYGAHLSQYDSQGAGWVDAGTTIGYVGSSGNASASAPHLHFEYHPNGGSPVNPYGILVDACF
jgi:murein DD-endopeptidase MepM/ murein hydrolase activator NlpD